MDPGIRPYRAEDFDPVTDLWRRARLRAFPEFQARKGHTAEEDRAYFRTGVLARHDVWVAEVNGEPAAFLAISSDFIDQLFVAPDHQRQGIGRALIAHAKRLSPAGLRLFTFQSNWPARGFYEAHGFVAVTFGVSAPPESEPDVEYRWTPGITGERARAAEVAGHDLLASRWDEEYRRGRYVDEPPLPFVATITSVLKQHGADKAEGLYVGCGNGRNYLPLVDGGLDLYGLDVSMEALRGLTSRRPALASHLIHADVRRFEPARPFGYLIAIQVFQHGAADDARAYFDKVAELLRPGGLFFLRVNSASTQIYHAHSVTERSQTGSFTIRYDAGPKKGLLVHFYSRAELQALAARELRPVGEPREAVIPRSPPQTGSWAQWEMIWARR